MGRRRPARLGSGPVVVAVLVLGAIVGPASAAPVFVDAATQLSGGLGLSTSGGGNCSGALTTPVATPVPVVENAPAASFTQHGSATFANSNNASDTGSAVADATITARITSANGSMRTIDLTGQGTGALIDDLAGGSACGRSLNASARVIAKFAIAQPGIVTLRVRGDGTLDGGVQLFVDDATSVTESVFTDATGLPTDSISRVFVQPGTYMGYAAASIVAGGGTTSRTSKGTVEVHLSYAAAGSQSAAPSGKAGKYVTFPAARSCTGHALVPTLTPKKTRAAKIKQVAFFLGDHRIAKVKKPKAGASVTVPLPDTEDAVVRAEVTLRPKHHGQKPKVVSVTAGYVACGV